MSHNLRDAAGFVKCREANDFHHAHDAYLACRVGLFISKWHPGIYEQPIAYAYAMRKYVRDQAELFNARHEAPGSSGFVIGSFMGKHVDEDTGELWDGAAEVEGIRKALNYRQCYITRMPVEDSGAFWDATIYSPRDPKMGPKLSLPLKSALDPQTYGGYSSQQFAYSFIYEARDKKGRTVFRFAEVPVWLAPCIRVDEGALEAHARRLAEGEKLQFVSIQRAKLLKKQLIEIDGERFLITGKRVMRNATEISLREDEIALLQQHLLKKASKPFSHVATLITADDLVESALQSVSRYANRLALLLKPSQLRDGMMALCDDEKTEIVLRILALANASTNMSDLSAAGGPKCAGYMQPTYSKLLSDPNVDFYIIDQSVTGMFERRTRVGL